MECIMEKPHDIHRKCLDLDSHQYAMICIYRLLQRLRTMDSKGIISINDMKSMRSIGTLGDGGINERMTCTR